jgi:hypothetical protein
VIARLLDWRLRKVALEYDMPDLPEVRKVMRLAWWNGLTAGLLGRRYAAAREEAREVVARMEAGDHGR